NPGPGENWIASSFRSLQWRELERIARHLPVLDALDIFGDAVALLAVPVKAGEALGDARFKRLPVGLAAVAQGRERHDLAGDDRLALCRTHADLHAPRIFLLGPIR